ncbi:ABC-type sugar transport system, ATPase component [Corynebacterium mustelae]|uniref:ABC-type sugar transport system, ATPase component n=1 Tax=Corynebacterium mustelae TaxID=571915 RepID=A0A0G3H1S4_9CORY|nr:sugar ABC transporter ATP-binding protein [Corynebacterium mustelae]AKK06680.1 ABC-type sugar transport system, ATPase component [Corynebacterium mustelae]
MSNHTDQAVLSLENLEKSFGKNQVLKGVSFTLHPGKVTALLGANGAGKSTLIKVLAGLYPPSGGTVYVGTDPVTITSPRDADAHGIQVVHQRVSDSIVPGLTVAENLCFEEIAANVIHPLTSPGKIMDRAREIIATLELEWDDSFLRTDVADLGIADGQLLLLARALIHQPKVLILDEPTSTLSHSEVERLFEKILWLKKNGVAILYVSHRMGEIARLADDLVVLRDGRIVFADTRPFELGRAIDAMLGTQPTAAGAVGGVAAAGDAAATSSDSEHIVVEEQRGTEVTIELFDVQVLPRSAPFDLEIRSGEVTGVLGLIGSGKTELAMGIYGVRPYIAGSIKLHGQPFTPRHPHDCVARGIYLVPEDRVEQAMLPDWSIADTVNLPFLHRVSTNGVLSAQRQALVGEKVIDNLGVICTDVHQSVDSLSGGNQQKVVVGRWLVNDPQIFILDEPFRGVDIGARREISRQLRELAAAGATVLVLSSDVDEIREVSDRVLVLVDGSVRLDSYNSELAFDTIVATMSEVA